MNIWFGCLLALSALLSGGLLFGWRGLVFSLSLIVFWLLLQVSRLMRVMRRAGAAPLGYVQSAVMLHSRLHAGMRMTEILGLTQSLGAKLEGEEEAYVWQDTGGDRVEVHLRSGKLRSWALVRAELPNDAMSDS